MSGIQLKTCLTPLTIPGVEPFLIPGDHSDIVGRNHLDEVPCQVSKPSGFREDIKLQFLCDILGHGKYVP